MSKRRFKKHPFDAPSRTYEKYMTNLEKSKSNETSQPLADEESLSVLGGTDTPIAPDAVPNYKSKTWEPPLWLKNIATYIAIALFLFGIVSFFWSMNASVNETKKDVSKVTESVRNVEKEVSGLARENAEHYSDLKNYFVELLSKLDRVLDRLPFSQNQDATKPLPQENNKVN